MKKRFIKEYDTGSLKISYFLFLISYFLFFLFLIFLISYFS